VFGTNQLVLGQQVHLYADGGTAVSVANNRQDTQGQRSGMQQHFFPGTS